MCTSGTSPVILLQMPTWMQRAPFLHPSKLSKAKGRSSAQDSTGSTELAGACTRAPVVATSQNHSLGRNHLRHSFAVLGTIDVRCQQLG